MRKIMVSAMAIVSSARIWRIVERISPKIWLRKSFQRYNSRNFLNLVCFPDSGTRSFRSLLRVIPYPCILHSWMSHPSSPPKEYLKLLKWKDFSCFQPGLNPFALA
ncbi:hypothetical protein Mapa_010476 [Marchantia paleacea]|nr:hypothetical protein Mapa_010476 [Marchantia paleacea]